MDIKQNFLRALRGEKTERVPLMMREGFGSWYEPKGRHAFTNGWMTENEYIRLAKAAEESGCVYYRAYEAPLTNRFMMTNNKCINVVDEKVSSDLIVHHGTLDLGHRKLHFRDETRRGLSTRWNVTEPIETWDDVEDLIKVPFEIDEKGFSAFENDIKYLQETSDGRTVSCVFIPSPMVTVSRSMTFDFFLEHSILEEERILEILEVITEREIRLVKEMVKIIPSDMIMWVGGSEQCTPPMMSPFSYDTFVTPFEKQLVQTVKANSDLIIGCHSHGKVSHALTQMVKSNFDATDPIEPPPQGDVTIEQAFNITENKITLIGNMQWSDLENVDCDVIRKQVRDLARFKDKRLILGASAGPISAVTKRVVDNHIAWFDEYNKCF